MCVKETKHKRYRESARLKFKRRLLRTRRRLLATGHSTDIAAADELEEEIRQESKKERTLFHTLETQDYCYGKYDICSAEFFRKWDPRSAGLPNVDAVADWPESSPVLQNVPP